MARLDKFGLPGQPLDLPGAKPDEQGEGGNEKQRGPEGRSKAAAAWGRCGAGHRGQEPVSNSSRRCRYCSASTKAFAGRSSASARAMTTIPLISPGTDRKSVV